MIQWLKYCDSMEKRGQSKLSNDDVINDCINSCTKCIEACKDISVSRFERLDASLSEKNSDLIKDCGEICSITVSFLSRNCEYSKPLCSICADICIKCLNRPSLKENYHFQKYTEVFQQCENDCRSLLQSEEVFPAP